MKKKRKISRCFLILILLVLTCVPAVSKDTITYWHFYGSEFGRIHEEAIDHFNSAHPQIRVKSQYIGSPWTGRDKLLTAVAAGSPPDVAMVDDYWIPQFAATKNIIKLGDYIDSETRSDIYPLFWESSSYKGEIWAVPYASSNLVLYFNKGLFSRAGLDSKHPPKTWDDLLSYARKLTSKQDSKGRVEQWGLMFPTLAKAGVIYNYIPFLWQNDGELLNEDCTKAAFNSPAGIEALSFMGDLINKHKVAPAAPPSKGYRIGNVAMTIASSARLNIVYRKAANFEVGVGPHPMKKKKVTVAGGKYFVAFDQGRLEAALEFINWMSNTENNLSWSMKTGYMPLRKSVVQSKTFKDYMRKDPESAVSVDQIEYTRPRPSIAAYGDISRVIGNAVESVLLANEDPAKALRAAVPEVEKVLRDWENRLK